MHIHQESCRNSTLPSCAALHDSWPRMLNVIGNFTSILCEFRSTQYAACLLLCSPDSINGMNGRRGMHSTHGTRFGTPGDGWVQPAVVTRAWMHSLTVESDFARGLLRGYSVSTLISSRQPTSGSCQATTQPWHAARLHASSQVAMSAPLTISLPTDS